MQSIKTLARKAFMNRYDYNAVTIDDSGAVVGVSILRNPIQKIKTVICNIEQCSASVNEHRTGVLFKLNTTLIYTFSMDVTR